MRKEMNECNTLAPITVASYNKRARQLWSKWRIESWPDVEVSDPFCFVRWMKETKQNWKAATWRQNKAAAIFSMTAERGAFWPLSFPQELEEAVLLLEKETQAGTNANSNKTSSLKARRVLPKEIVVLERYFAASRSKYAHLIRCYFKVGTECGLRPVEWADARVLQSLDGKIILRAQNAKKTFGRSHGEYRTLTWNNPPIGFKKDLLAWLALVESVSGRDKMARLRWEAVLEGMRDELARACRRIWPKRKRHITLYSVRHEAAAIWKLYYRPEEVAALLGHATDETAYRHYGRILASRGGIALSLHDLLPTPSRDEVNRVRRSDWQLKQSALLSPQGPAFPDL